jgi:hypothetical protein
MPRFHYVKNKKTGMVIDIPEKDLEETMKRGEFEYVSAIQDAPVSLSDIPIIEDEEEDPAYIEPLEAPLPVVEKEAKDFQCNLCGYNAKSDQSLRIHRGRLHK